ncbi:nucleoid-associated protein [Volucribacter psittacicida]|uniref:Nucleoid-associated protein EV694_0087 n=1 Tax=Volucribacter psittacicida TaxID=203482 RepID=A0A4V2PCJ4_9PAST|nr:nucleoid-associated protein YejK [Volucribacter psittacicida]TCK01476.1 nucleoid-associated protein [Volucribacter psittacicida]
MSINVKQIVLHQLVAETPIEQEASQAENQVSLAVQLRQEVLPVNAEVQQMMLLLHQGYQNKAKGYGVFQSSSLFAQWLNEFLEREQDFLTFSHQSAKLLATELSKYVFADSGTFILCQYNFLATDYLFIALLDSRSSMLVDDNLEIHRTQYLDINQFDIACRINLTELQVNANSNRYLTFVKGRVGRKVSDFFLDFLGAETGLDPQLQNQCLLQAVEDYCEQGELNKEQTRAVKKQVFDYCKGQINAGDEIGLRELSDNMPTLNEQPFADFTAQQDYGLEQSIPPVRSALKSLTKFSGSGKGITISFDAALLNSRIYWDANTDTLTIKGIPPNLREQLEKQKD